MRADALTSALMRFRHQRPQVAALPPLTPLPGFSLVGGAGCLAVELAERPGPRHLAPAARAHHCSSAVVLPLPTSQREAAVGTLRTFGAVGLVDGVLARIFSTAAPPMVFHLYRRPLALAWCETPDRDLRGQWRLAAGGDGAGVAPSLAGAVVSPQRRPGARANLLDGTPPRRGPGHGAPRGGRAVDGVGRFSASPGRHSSAELQARPRRCVLRASSRATSSAVGGTPAGDDACPFAPDVLPGLWRRRCRRSSSAGVALRAGGRGPGRRDDGRPQVVAVHAGELLQTMSSLCPRRWSAWMASVGPLPHRSR